MDIYELIRNLRARREWYRLSPLEQCLYFELVCVCNTMGWNESFPCRNSVLLTNLNIKKEETLRLARNRLVEVGLIRYTSGKSKWESGSYTFVTDQAGLPVSVEQMQTEAPAATQRDIKAQAKEQFETFRQRYPGTKRRLETEFGNFVSKNKDTYRQTIPLLLPALEAQIADRWKKMEQGVLVPEFPRMQTWINERRWEEEKDNSFNYYNR